jgi:hypothetical protein
MQNIPPAVPALGKNAMLSWGDVLQDDHIDDLWIYVTTQPAQ